MTIRRTTLFTRALETLGFFATEAGTPRLDLIAVPVEKLDGLTWIRPDI
ncbi:MAG: hypothetical protein ACREXS_13225 [Gammaproteobacteria bacterium]